MFTEMAASFFLLPGYHRGGGWTDAERLKNKMLRKKMALNGSAARSWIIDLGENERRETGKSILCCRQVFPPEQINDPEKSIIHTLRPPPVFVFMSLSL